MQITIKIAAVVGALWGDRLGALWGDRLGALWGIPTKTAIGHLHTQSDRQYAISTSINYTSLTVQNN